MKLRKLVLIGAIVGGVVAAIACLAVVALYVIFFDPVGMQ